MSDFGSTVLVWRVDGQSVCPEEEARLRAAIRAVKGEPQHDRFVRFDEFECRIGGYGRLGGVEGFSVGLTGYFVGDEDGNDGLDPEVILAREHPLAQEFADELARALGEDYEVRAISDFW
jgi:hypothetical protein